MIDYRPFRNTDPPGLCEIWRSHSPLRAVFRPLTPNVLEANVLSKRFFDPKGLIVASEDGKPVGFAHAGFACSQDGSGLDTSVGATCMLLVSGFSQRPHVARELLMHSERYLRQRGAQKLYGGGSPTIAPFYLGLYGGATVPGILATDLVPLALYAEAGYAETGRRSIMQRLLAGWRPLVDRQQIQLRRSLPVESVSEPPSRCWFEACTMGLTDRFCFTTAADSGGNRCATATFWDIEPLASSWGVRARGLTHVQIQTTQDRDALTLYVIGEALRRMALEGATLAEIHISAVDDPLQPILNKLGFLEVEQALELTKVVPP